MTLDVLDAILPPSGPDASTQANITYGKITSADPIAVQFNGTASGSAVSGVLAVDDFTPEVGDLVILVRVGPSWVILGTIATTPSGGALPIGAIIPYANAAPPSLWLPCDGSAVSRTVYPGLFDKLGTYYGAGNGSTTFNVPDLRGRTVIGTGDGGSGFTNRTLGSTVGSETHTLSEAEMPSHTHAQNPHSHGSPAGGSFVINRYPAQPGRYVPGGGDQHTDVDGNTSTASTTASNKSTGGGGAHNNMQPSIALNYIIRAL